MEPIHMNAKKEDIAPICVMPGDPLRAKYIAEKFLTDAKLVSNVRNMYAYTGTYKGTKVTVMGHGMGMPSIGIYCYELFHFYDVEKIIRIGTSGSNKPEVKVKDMILSSGCSTISNFSYLWGRYDDKFAKTNEELNKTILETAKSLNIDLKYGPTFTSDIFDVYCNIDDILEKDPLNNQILAKEMEGFALMHIAKTENKQASMLLTVVDSQFEPDVIVSKEDREKSLDQMITLALESIIK